jgi:hypothetical protein
VGDRVICRNNERDLDVDNGTRGTVRHVEHAVDRDRDRDRRAHDLTRELPAGYVAEHVEHAYALTGHGMQGATVEQAVVVASAHDLTRGWSYTALSRARGETRLLGVEDPHFADRIRLRSVLDSTEGAIERTLTERDTLARQVGNPDAIRIESDGLRNALQQARREHNQTLKTLVERELAGRPEWTREALGERPDGAWRGRQWDETAAKLARYRITYDITNTQDPLGPEPPAGEQRREYQQAQRSRERTIERDAPGRDIDL